MIYAEPILETLNVQEDDLPKTLFQAAVDANLVAVDIETSGLSWKTDTIGTCQVYVPGQQPVVIRINGSIPHRLGLLIGDRRTCKVFHHAMFDLRFMAHHWHFSIENIACTKIASKILSPEKDKHSLKDLVQEYLGVTIDKSMQISDWLAPNLSSEQLQYGVLDVIYLPKLLKILGEKLVSENRWWLAEASFRYIPARVQLDILGSRDVFRY